MNKRITSIVLCLVLLIGLVAAVVPASAAGSTSFKMTADKTEANPGDTITYTVSMGAVEDIYGLKLKLIIPEGLTYVEGSGKAAAGLQDLMNAAKAEFTESTKVFIIGSCDYTSTTDTVLMQFQCTVDEDAVGPLEIGFEIDPDNVFDKNYDNIGYTVTTASVDVIVSCNHSWNAADCTTAKTCALCGETEGEALGHDWADATCTAPETCSVCGETQGEALGHTMNETLSSDENGHWYDCPACDHKSEVEEHGDGDEDTLCDACGYELPEEPVAPEGSEDPEEPVVPEDPEDPEEPVIPEDPTDPEEESPETADVEMTGIFAILLIAVCGMALVISKKRFVR